VKLPKIDALKIPAWLQWLLTGWLGGWLLDRAASAFQIESGVEAWLADRAPAVDTFARLVFDPYAVTAAAISLAAISSYKWGYKRGLNHPAVLATAAKLVKEAKEKEEAGTYLTHSNLASLMISAMPPSATAHFGNVPYKVGEKTKLEIFFAAATKIGFPVPTLETLLDHHSRAHCRNYFEGLYPILKQGHSEFARDKAAKLVQAWPRRPS
jgi:hypothetical protein